ncbi:MAG TPA: glycosyltransferase family 39 protein [Candidatus Binatia bacterium]|nr:glycosyltransferase family 39 protein [Candidatus Binatia bacterium]
MIFFTGLGARDFWAPVEPRYAEIARVMFSNAEWIVPTVNGELYTDKPILYFWLVLIASHAVGVVNEWTVRLPSAIGALGLVLTTYAFGRDFFSPRVGFMAGAILATSVRAVWEGRWAHMDMLFTCFFTLSIYFAARAVFKLGSRNEMLLAHSALALATLTKGLIGVVLPALIFLSLVIIRRDWRLILEARLPWGIIIFLLVAAPWFVLVDQATDGRWLREFFYIHHIQRYTAGEGHREPFYYYLTTLPADFSPWTVLAIPALFASRSWRKAWSQPVVVFFVLWFSAVFLFFSLSDTKRDLYLLPLFPTLALLVATYMNDLTAGSLAQRSAYQVPALVLFAALTIIGLSFPAAAWIFRREVFWISLPASVLLAAGGVFGIRFLRAREPLKVFLSIVLLMVSISLYAPISIFPYLERFKSPRPFSDTIKTRVPSAAPLYVYADKMNDFNFYTEREIIPVVSSPSVLQKLAAQGQASYLLIKKKDMPQASFLAEETVLARQGADEKSWYLFALGNRRRP